MTGVCNKLKSIRAVLLSAALSSAALAVVMTAPASAADLGGDYRGSYKDDVPYVAPVFNWTGGYAGLQFGYGWGDSDATSSELGFGV